MLAADPFVTLAVALDVVLGNVVLVEVLIETGLWRWSVSSNGPG